MKKPESLEAVTHTHNTFNKYVKESYTVYSEALLSNFPKSNNEYKIEIEML